MTSCNAYNQFSSINAWEVVDATTDYCQGRQSGSGGRIYLVKNWQYIKLYIYLKNILKKTQKQLHTNVTHFQAAICCKLTPTPNPTESPTDLPTESPTGIPTRPPSKDPTKAPTESPTSIPTRSPSKDPTSDPTKDPTDDPTSDPTTDPTNDPTNDPSIDPTVDPTIDPTLDPTIDPSSDPTFDPTSYPTTQPTAIPTSIPTSEPTMIPSNNPTMEPTLNPTAKPTTRAPAESNLAIKPTTPAPVEGDGKVIDGNNQETTSAADEQEDFISQFISQFHLLIYIMAGSIFCLCCIICCLLLCFCRRHRERQRKSMSEIVINMGSDRNSTTTNPNGSPSYASGGENVETDVFPPGLHPHVSDKERARNKTNVNPEGDHVNVTGAAMPKAIMNPTPGGIYNDDLDLSSSSDEKSVVYGNNTTTQGNAIEMFTIEYNDNTHQTYGGNGNQIVYQNEAKSDIEIQGDDDESPVGTSDDDMYSPDAVPNKANLEKKQTLSENEDLYGGNEMIQAQATISSPRRNFYD